MAAAQVGPGTWPHSVLLEISTVELRPAEKLILLMLTDLMEGAKIDSEIDPAFIRKAVINDHAWAISWEYSRVEEGAQNPAEVEDVVSILNAWRMIEQGFATADKDQFPARDWTHGYPSLRRI
jgi:hypothetical protein